ncbi:hypothetical protein MY4038_003013 [Beauveria bassiana]
MAPKFSSLTNLVKRASSQRSRTPTQGVDHPHGRAHPQGLEVVYDGDNPIVDIIALHGLNGHREKTWTARNGVHWLRDLLPEDLPQARILCWGYDANTHAADREEETDEPHSLGGLVLKSALIHSDAARQGANPEHRSIKLSTYGILFMGTPHQGGNGVQLGRVLANIASLVMAADDRLLKHLERDSEWLLQQLGQYGPISNEFVTKFAYETYPTPTVLGRSIMVVPMASAVVPGHANAEPIGVPADHTSMVRYVSRQDEGYVMVSELLQIMVKDAANNVQRRWEEETRVEDARGNVNRFNLPLSLPLETKVKHFVGREEELAWIHRELTEPDGGQTAVVHGLGGMGKTQLAIAYMKRHRNDYSALIWLNARDEILLSQSFRLAAMRISREHPNLSYMQIAASDKDADASQAVRRWLNEPKNNRWLLIYDNYDHPKVVSDADEVPNGVGDNRGKTGRLDQQTPQSYDIRQYLPDTASDSGAVLITTRSTSVNIGSMKTLTKLESIDDSLEILESTSGRPNLKEDLSAAELAKLLDGLPLALASAGAYLKGLTTSCAQYIDLYKQEWSDLHQRPQGLLSEDKTLFSTWNVSYEFIKAKDENAAKLLHLWSYFDNNDLWYELLKDGKEHKQPWHHDIVLTRLSFDKTMRILCSHGLVEAHTEMLSKESQGYRVHTCVHEWMANVLNRDMDREMVREMVRTALDCIASHVPSMDEPEFWLTQRRLMAHADRYIAVNGNNTQQNTDSVARSKLGNLYTDQGRLKKAEAMYQRALEGSEKAWGPDHTSTLITVNNLGILYADQGRLKEAEAMFQRALEGCEKAWGPDHTSTLITVNNLGVLYADQRRLKEAEAMYQRALEGKEKAWGPDHTSTLDTVHNLGNLYKNQGRLEEAEAIHQRVLNSNETV